MRVMLVNDSRSSLLHLQILLDGSGKVESEAFADPDLALEAAGSAQFDPVIVDHIMPRMDGFALIRRLRALQAYAEVPVVMLTGTASEAVRLEALEAGATDFLAKTSSRVELGVRLRNLILLAEALLHRQNRAVELTEKVEAATQALQASKDEVIFLLALAVEYRENDTGDHTVRVARYSRMIAEEVGMPEAACHAIYMAAPLHDIGKVAIPDNVLLKPGRLTEAETATMRAHAEIGERILGGSTSELIRLAAEIAGNHHERWDGAGYPRRLAGSAIPLSARIVAVADAFDALTTARPYKAAMVPDAALAEIRAERERHFDPTCVDAFVAAYARIRPPVPARQVAP